MSLAWIGVLARSSALTFARMQHILSVQHEGYLVATCRAGKLSPNTTSPLCAPTPKKDDLVWRCALTVGAAQRIGKGYG